MRIGAGFKALLGGVLAVACCALLPLLLVGTSSGLIALSTGDLKLVLFAAVFIALIIGLSVMARRRFAGPPSERGGKN